jgi:hypothetical protein
VPAPYRLRVLSSAGQSVCATCRRPAVRTREDAPDFRRGFTICNAPSLAQQQSSRPISERPRGGTWRKDQSIAGPGASNPNGEGAAF